MTITNNKSKNRYEILTDGHLSVADYTLSETILAITHVEVPPELRGKGIAAQLMAGVVEDATARRLIIKPICSYAAAYMQLHPQ